MINLTNLQNIIELGRGGNGIVYHIITNQGQDYAVKVIEGTGKRLSALKEFRFGNYFDH